MYYDAQNILNRLKYTKGFAQKLLSLCWECIEVGFACPWSFEKSKHLNTPKCAKCVPNSSRCAKSVRIHRNIPKLTKDG